VRDNTTTSITFADTLPSTSCRDQERSVMTVTDSQRQRIPVSDHGAPT
jgi:hypothetical protein